MNTNNHHTRTPQTPVFMPERWLLLGYSESWLIAARAWMRQNHTAEDPLGWRLRHGLVQLTTLDELSAHLLDALRSQPPIVHVFAEAGKPDEAVGGLDGVIAARWPTETDPQQAMPQVYLGELGQTFDQATELLSDPDNAPADYWLLSGRSVWPSIRLPQPDAAFEADAQGVFQAWANAYAAAHNANDLDAIYGSAGTFADRMSEAWDDSKDLVDQAKVDHTARPAVIPVVGRQLTQAMARPLALAASPVGAAAPEDIIAKGSFDSAGETKGESDLYLLCCPGPVIAGSEAEALTVKLDLVADRWQGCSDLVLEIHSEGHRVIFVEWSDLNSGRHENGRLRLEHSTRLTERHRKALLRGLELWLQPATSRANIQ